MDTRDRFFSLLRVAIGEGETEVVPAEELPALFELANAHDLAHLVCYALKKTGNLPEEPAAVVAAFKKQFNLSVYRATNLGYEYARLCEVLEEAQIPFIPLKGTVLRPLYSEPWMRTSCDIDVLVKEEDHANAVRVLCEKLNGTADKETPHDQTIVTESGVHIELHFLLIIKQKKAANILSDVWENACPVSGKSFQKEMSDAMFYLYHIAHMSKHFLIGGCGVRPFLDLFLLDKQPRFAHERVDTLLEEGGLLAFANEARRLSRVWFAGEEHTDVTKRLEDYLLSGGLYGSGENNDSMDAAKMRSFKYILSRLFMPYDQLKTLYPKLEKHKWLLPWYEVKRWAARARSGRVNEVYRNMQNSEEAGNLIHDLGL